MAGSTDFAINIIGDSQSAVRAFNETGDAAAAQSGKFDKMKATVTVASAAIVTGVVAIGVKATESASNLSEAGTAVEAIFGPATDSINSWAEGAASAFGQSELSALNAAKTFGVFGQAAGLTEKENAEFSQSLTELASDFASFHNVSPEEAIEAIGAGLRGEAEPLRKFGILMDDASLKAKALEMGIYEGNGTLTQQQKILAANALITEQAGAAAGDFARTSGSLANQQRTMNAAMENLSATIGELLLPVLQGIMGAALPFVTFLQENPALVQALAIAVGVLTVAIIAANIAMWALAANPIVLLIMAIIVAVGLLIAGIWLLVANWDTVVAWLTEVWAGFVAWFMSVMAGFASWWNSFWAGIGQFIADVWNNGIITPIQNAINWLTSAIGAAMNLIGAAWRNTWNGFTGIVRGIWNGILGFIENGVNGAIRLINGMTGGIRDALGAVGINIGVIPNVHIPRLAAGTVTSGPMLALIGDNPGGREVVRSVDSYDRELRRAYESGRSGGGNVVVEIVGDAAVLEQIVDVRVTRGISAAEDRSRMTTVRGKRRFA